MKKILIILCLLPFLASAQSVLFDKTAYKTGEDVTVTLLKKAMGASNGISLRSEPAIVAGKYNLGKNSRPGMYQVEFVFSGTEKETYSVLILPADAITGTFSAITVAKPANSRFTVFLNALTKYSKDNKSFGPILNAAAASFIAKHAIDGPVAVVGCIGVPLSGGNPVFIYACKQTAAPVAKDLVICMLEAVNQKLYADQYINKADYDYFKDNIKIIDFFASYAAAGNLYDKLMAVANVTAKDDKNQLLMGADYADQFYKKYQIVLKFK